MDPLTKRRLLTWGVPAVPAAATVVWRVAADGIVSLDDLHALWIVIPYLFVAAMIGDSVINSKWYTTATERGLLPPQGLHEKSGYGDEPEFLSWEERRYGERHQELRRHYAGIVREYGATCMELVCVMPSRRIERGAPFHLAHDHEAGGDRDYLGPAHPECNRAEAEGRLGVSFAASSAVVLESDDSTDDEDDFDLWDEEDVDDGDDQDDDIWAVSEQVRERDTATGKVEEF